jgi:RES domain-containing protein
MVLWRISRQRGVPVVYLAETAPGALLEVCVPTAANDVPPSYTLLEVTVPSSTTIETIRDVDHQLLQHSPYDSQTSTCSMTKVGGPEAV